MVLPFCVHLSGGALVSGIHCLLGSNVGGEIGARLVRGSTVSVLEDGHLSRHWAHFDIFAAALGDMSFPAVAAAPVPSSVPMASQLIRRVLLRRYPVALATPAPPRRRWMVDVCMLAVGRSFCSAALFGPGGNPTIAATATTAATTAEVLSKPLCKRDRRL